MIKITTLIEQIKGESHTLGIDIGSQAIKAVLTRHFADGRFEVEKATLVEMRKGVIREGQIASEEASKDPDGPLEGITPRQWVRRTLGDVFHRLGVAPQDVDLCVSPPWSGVLLIDHFQIQFAIDKIHQHFFKLIAAVCLRRLCRFPCHLRNVIQRSIGSSIII